MQSLFSCLFALLLYSGWDIHSHVHNCPPLVDNTAGEHSKRGEQAREENTDAIEIMQVWEDDSEVNEDVQGVRATAAVETHDIQQHTARRESSRVLCIKGMAGNARAYHWGL